MKKILWTSVFWIVVAILSWAYVRFFDADLGNRISYCMLNVQTESTDAGSIDYSDDILLINDQLADIQNKMEEILLTLGGQELAPEASLEEEPTPGSNPYFGNPIFE